jgi:hypothetical protein
MFHLRIVPERADASLSIQADGQDLSEFRAKGAFLGPLISFMDAPLWAFRFRKDFRFRKGWEIENLQKECL